MPRKKIQTWVCFLLATLVAMATFLFADMDESAARPFFALIATIAGTLLGFAMTSLAILISVGDSKLLNNLKKEKIGLYQSLVRGINISAVMLFLTMVLSVVLFFHVSNFSMAVIVFLFVLALEIMFLAGRTFFAILDVLGMSQGDQNNID